MRFSQSYSVFDKELHELVPADLVRLREVPEGWFVEYKRQFPSVLSAAKSLSAFANSYGGWLFYGVTEKPDGTRLAGEFTGIPATEVSNAEQWLHQAASQHITPAPYYTRKVLYGPFDEIGLGSDRAVIAIHIPVGRNAPYVHSSGRIYRRVTESSDPVPETDRHYLDLLWERGRESRRKFAKQLKARPEISKGEQCTRCKASEIWQESSWPVPYVALLQQRYK
jgi:predicted HTH transcriptional regulator